MDQLHTITSGPYSNTDTARARPAADAQRCLLIYYIHSLRSANTSCDSSNSEDQSSELLSSQEGGPMKGFGGHNLHLHGWRVAVRSTQQSPSRFFSTTSLYTVAYTSTYYFENKVLTVYWLTCCCGFTECHRLLPSSWRWIICRNTYIK